MKNQGGPDGGYSWVIVLCCAYIHFALFGLFRSSGVVYVAILQDYDVTREEASWAFALCAAVFQLVGPLASATTHYMSQRKACLLGSAIATFGIGGCYFAESVMWINICYGIIHGLGFGFIVTFVPVILNQYFLKYRATAMGIAFSGGSASSLLFPVVMEWLLENYTLNDSFLLLSGVVMNTLVASSLLRPPPWLEKSRDTKEELSGHSEAKDSGVSACDDANGKIKAAYAVEMVKTFKMETFMVDETDVASRSLSENHHNGAPNSAATDAAEDSSGRPNNFDTLHSNCDSVLFDCSLPKDDDSTLKANQGDCGSREVEVREPLMLSSVHEKEISIVSKNFTKYEERDGIVSRTRHSITYVLKQPMFHFITFSMGVYFLGAHIVFMVMVDFAKDKGIPESKGVYIISMFSITDLFGRACLGWVTDRNFIRRKTMIGLNFGVLGILYQLYPLTNSLPMVLVVSAINGLAIGSSITLFFVLQAECLGMSRLTLVIGLTSFINGTLSLLRPGIIGLFRDVIGSYNWMFHSIGVLTLIFSAVWLVHAWKTRPRTVEILKL